MDEAEKKRILDKWRWFVITTTPDDPLAGQQRTVRAANQLDALDEDARLNGFAAYTETEDWHEFVGVDHHGLYAISGNQTIWAIPADKVPPPKIDRLIYDGLWVNVSRNTLTGQLIVMINSENCRPRDRDSEGQAYIEIVLDGGTLHDYEGGRE